MARKTKQGTNLARMTNHKAPKSRDSQASSFPCVMVKVERRLSDSKMLVIAASGGWPVARYIGHLSFQDYYVKLYLYQYLARGGEVVPKKLPRFEFGQLLRGVTVKV